MNLKRFIHRKIHGLLTSWEQGHLQTPAQPKFRPVFVLGMPRSGTTVVYQYLLSKFQWSFFSNRERKYHRAPITSARIWKSANRFQPSFESNFGDINGVNAPSDGWEIFQRWFSYFYNPAKTSGNLQELVTTIAKVESVYDRPFIVKNNANSLRFFELGDVFPNAIFVVVRRKITSNIHSIIKGRHKNHIPADQFWSAAPERELVDTKFENELQLVCFQYHFVSQFLEQCCAPQFESIAIDYDDFTQEPESLGKLFEERYGAEIDVRNESIDYSSVIRPRSEKDFGDLVDSLRQIPADIETRARCLADEFVQGHHRR